MHWLRMLTVNDHVTLTFDILNSKRASFMCVLINSCCTMLSPNTVWELTVEDTCPLEVYMIMCCINPHFTYLLMWTLVSKLSIWFSFSICTRLSALTLLLWRQAGYPACKKYGGWWRWALVSPDGVAPSRMVGVSASVNILLHHKVQKFSSGTGSLGWSRKRGRKTVVVVVPDLCLDFSCRPWHHPNKSFLFHLSLVPSVLIFVLDHLIESSLSSTCSNHLSRLFIGVCVW